MSDDPLEYYGRCPHPADAAQQTQSWENREYDSYTIQDVCGWCGTITRRHFDIRSLMLTGPQATPFLVEHI